jgi:hypothetical protein
MAILLCTLEEAKVSEERDMDDSRSSHAQLMYFGLYVHG